MFSFIRNSKKSIWSSNANFLSLQPAFLDIYVNAVLSAKEKPRKSLTEAFRPPYLQLSHEDFQNTMIPSSVKMLKRNPEIVLDPRYVFMLPIVYWLCVAENHAIRFEYNLSCNESTLHVQSAAQVVYETKEPEFIHIYKTTVGIELLFQVVDDILDVTKSSRELRKTAGKDIKIN
ncbi:hypothetical protein RIF29_24416 [Crotalaria pallida]|uniref:Stalled ribosome sensor GCN1-like N-terminal domain-containing protein n=1 Tax=Crotalaria pallida TaxID=3830 RepID=A0AAN9ERY2_CROPI